MRGTPEIIYFMWLGVKTDLQGNKNDEELKARGR